jgi:hypothetical protein
MKTELRDIATADMAFALGHKFTGGSGAKVFRNGKQLLSCKLDGHEMTCMEARHILEPKYLAKGLHR